MEVWIHQFSVAGKTPAAANQIEAWGFDGMFLADSQDVTADIWVELALASAATSSLKLGPGVTNLVTRHPAVTASAAAALQVESGGRVVLGLGRGDSAVSKIGLRPQAVHEFEAGIGQLQAYLAGERVTVEGGADSAIEWLAASAAPKVPLAVAATGPKVIAAAAPQTEMLNFTVGAEPARLRWAIGAAREASDGRSLSLGAFIDVGVAADLPAARDLVRGSTATLARFGAESSSTQGLSDETETGIRRLSAEYEEATHGQAGSVAARDLDDDFIDRFAVCGPPDQVTERLLELAGLGLDRIVIVPGSLGADPAAVVASNELFASEVLPNLR